MLRALVTLVASILRSGRAERRPPTTIAPWIRRVLQHGARPHLDRRCARRSPRSSAALRTSQG